MMRTLYCPGYSTIHRIPAGLKLGMLAVSGTSLFWLTNPLAMAGVLVASVLLYPAARLSLRLAWQQLRPAWPVLVFLFAFQAWTGDLWLSATVVMRLAALLLLASLVTVTTRTSAMIEAVETAFRPLRHIGIDPGRISLAISLALRFVPALLGVMAEVRDAQRARGLDRSMLALVVPMLVRTLKMADAVAEAIDARS